MIKNYLTYIKEDVNVYSDIDPYGEENWDIEEIRVGDTIMCTDDHPSIIRPTKYLQNGSFYEVVEIQNRSNGDYVRLKDIPDLFWSIKRFVKK